MRRSTILRVVVSDVLFPTSTSSSKLLTTTTTTRSSSNGYCIRKKWNMNQYYYYNNNSSSKSYCNLCNTSNSSTIRSSSSSSSSSNNSRNTRCNNIYNNNKNYNTDVTIPRRRTMMTISDYHFYSYYYNQLQQQRQQSQLLQRQSCRRRYLYTSLPSFYTVSQLQKQLQQVYTRRMNSFVQSYTPPPPTTTTTTTTTTTRKAITTMMTLLSISKRYPLYLYSQQQQQYLSYLLTQQLQQLQQYHHQQQSTIIRSIHTTTTTTTATAAKKKVKKKNESQNIVSSTTSKKKSNTKNTNATATAATNTVMKSTKKRRSTLPWHKKRKMMMKKNKKLKVKATTNKSKSKSITTTTAAAATDVPIPPLPPSIEVLQEKQQQKQQNDSSSTSTTVTKNTPNTSSSSKTKDISNNKVPLQELNGYYQDIISSTLASTKQQQQSQQSQQQQRSHLPLIKLKDHFTDSFISFMKEVDHNSPTNELCIDDTNSTIHNNNNNNKKQKRSNDGTITTTTTTTTTTNPIIQTIKKKIQINAWHSIFTCPITKQTFPAGLFKDPTSQPIYIVPNDVTDDVNNNNNNKYPLYYYTTRKMAESAAAAHALDTFFALDPNHVPYCVYHHDHNNNTNNIDTTTNDPINTTTNKDNMVHPATDCIVQDETSNVVNSKSSPQKQKRKVSIDSTKKLMSPQEYYRKEYNISKLDDTNYISERISGHSFTYYQNKNDPIMGWTATFICPISGIHYPSGTIMNHHIDDNMNNNNNNNEEQKVLLGHWLDDTNSSNSTDKTVSQNESNYRTTKQQRPIIYYRSKGSAQDAASKYAMDMIQYRIHHKLTPRFCTENPIDEMKWFEQSDTNTESISVATVINKKTNDTKNITSKRHTSEPPLLPPPPPIPIGSNSDLLQKIESKLVGKMFDVLSEEEQPRDHNENKQVFVFNNKSFLESITSKKHSSLSHEQLGVETQVLHTSIDGSMKTIEHQPIAKLVSDSIIDNSVKVSDEVQESVVTSDVVQDTLATNKLLEVGYSNTTVDYAFVEDHYEPQIDYEKALLMGLTDNDDDDDEQDYEIIGSLTSIRDVTTIKAKAPAQSLLESASNNTIDFPLFIDTDSTGNVNANYQGTAGKSIVVKHTDLVVMAAESWLSSRIYSSSNSTNNYNRQDNPHRFTLPRKEENTQILTLAKMVLSGLASASQATPIGISTAPIEPVAKRVLDTLWKTSHVKSIPDADTYTYFIKCLDGVSPITAVEKAEAIVEAMIKNAHHNLYKSYKLPKPNQGTYNALIQSTAQLGGTTGRYPRYTDYSDFIPDRQSFLSILSSCVYSPCMDLEKGGFDREFVEECIERMTDLAKEYNDNQLLPDTYIYNAPLRWSGGPTLWIQSRPYTRLVPWDDYEQIYAKGVKENILEDDIRVQQSKDMESWLEMMEKESVSNKRIAPNVETYEAVIQGWLRTGTREGLNRAQSILNRLIAYSETNPALKPRLQTFHPILASFYHAKLDDSEEKIFDLISEYEELIAGTDISLDSRLIGMKLATLLQKQRTLFRDRKQKPNDNTTENRHEEIVSNAMLCSKLVHDASSVLEDKANRGIYEDRPLDVSLFVQAAKALEYVTALGLECKDPKMTNDALLEMISLYARFEDLVKALKPQRGFSFRYPKSLCPQLDHMVQFAQQFLCHIVVQLSLHHNVNDRPEVILLLEQMTRLIAEFEEIEARLFEMDDKKSKFDYDAKRLVTVGHEALPDDHFNYQFKKENVLSVTRHAFLWQVVKFLQQVASDNDNLSDLVRLCHLVKEAGGARRRSTLLNEEVDKVLQKMHQNFSYRNESSVHEKTTNRDVIDAGKGKNQKKNQPSSAAATAKKPAVLSQRPRRRKTSTSDGTKKKINGEM